MQHGDPVAREVGNVEGQDAVDAVRQHRCDQARVIDLGARHSVGDDEALPYRIDRRIVCRQLNSRSIVAISAATAPAVRPRPLAAPTGRVAAAQNSMMFCGVT